MSPDDGYGKPISFDDLQQFKVLNLLPEAAVTELAKLEALDLTGFYEQEVRTFLIDPLVRLLGYDKGTDFSVDLGRPIEFLDKNKFPDYKFHLWQENFWLIEAKRPLTDRDTFGYDELTQAVEYAAHPNINAALVVLCDGLKIEIFDREVSLTQPVLHVDRTNLRRDFDKLRALLEPIQVWFFQKRRIVRLIDKVFDKEFNQQRVEEFKALIDRRLTSKRGLVLENFRRNVKPDTDDRKQYLLSAPIEELVEVQLFIEHPIPQTNTLIGTLIERGVRNSFHVLHKVFPDLPRDINDIYMAHACAFLAGLSEKLPTANWFPAWLARAGGQNPANTAKAAQYLLKQCLTSFEEDEPRKIILLAAAAIRRILKLSFLSNEAQWRIGELRHFLARYQVEELSWNQIISSPQGHLIGLLDGVVMTTTVQFVNDCRPERGVFKTEMGKLQLRDLWKFERALLASVDNYPKLRMERNLGDMRITEAADITYDVLGHTALCLLHPFPRWTGYALAEYRPLIEKLAAMNSWKARELLRIDRNEKLAPVSNVELADRFFFGDVAILEALTGRLCKPGVEPAGPVISLQRRFGPMQINLGGPLALRGHALVATRPEPPWRHLRPIRSRSLPQEKGGVPLCDKSFVW